MKAIKVLGLSLYILICSQFSTAQSFDRFLEHTCSHAIQNTIDPRADTFDVIEYHIEASFLNFAQDKSIKGLCEIELAVLENVTTINIDLLGLSVDSVLIDGQDRIFNYSSPNLYIQTGSLSKGDTVLVKIFYGGKPQKDAQWGGFYYTNEYAFNMGVGFASDPHNFGRVWFPCFDNFTDKAKYSFEITVENPYRAYCNGLLESEINNGNGTSTYTWKLNQVIPTYLASVAIAKYEEVKFDVQNIPVLVTGLEADTSDIRTSFQNLPKCIDGFVNSYGAHRFDRIGFNVVPFNAGAMEHATNIAYPRNAIVGGSLAQERLYAHELAHHWWGNNTTCKTQEDMWLNEGWANYSEYLFSERVYGKTEYLRDIKENHKYVLQFAHTNAGDGQALPVSGIDHSNTYGRHVYRKGGDMVHTLRGIMGDSAFFNACAGFQETYKYQNVTTDDMMNFFEIYTLYDLGFFFEQWIKTEGFCHFYIFSSEKENNKYELRIKQDQRFNSVVYQDIPYTIRAYDENLNFYDTIVILGGLDNLYTIELPFEPKAWVLDPEEWISDATTENMQEVTAGGLYIFDDATSELDVKQISNPSLVRVELHWIQPDHFYMNIPNLALHTQRYWSFDGVWDSSFETDLVLEYNGLGNVYLDNELIRITEDSLVLMYRPNAWSYWQIADNYNKDQGSKFDRRGKLTVHNAQKGQYALAMYDRSLLSGLEQLARPDFRFKPNPAQEYLVINFDQKKERDLNIEITDLNGKVVSAHHYQGRFKDTIVLINELVTGVYYLVIADGNYSYEPKKLVIK